MNRPRRAKGPYPPCFYEKHGAYYLVRQNKWTRLGGDLATALAEYGKRMEVAKLGGMPKLIDDLYPKIIAGKSEATKKQYRYAADVLKRKLAQFEPREVKPVNVVGIQDSLVDTPNMANRVISVLRSIFNEARRLRKIDSNPCVGIERLDEAKRERLITDAEWKKIHAEAGPRLQVIMELQYLTGQRISDVLSIRRSQISEEGIEFKQQKTGAKLLVRWSPDLKAAFARANALSEGLPPALTLLRGRWGGAPDYRSVARQWADACAAAEVVGLRLNDGRAKSATAAKKQGKDATALLGHASPEMTRRYLRDRETPQVDGPSFRQVLDT